MDEFNSLFRVANVATERTAAVTSHLFNPRSNMKSTIFCSSKPSPKLGPKPKSLTKKRIHNLILAITSMAMVGFITSSVFAQQYYSQPVYSSSYNQSQFQGQAVYPQTNSYPVYESVPTAYSSTSYPTSYSGNQVVNSYPQNTYPQNVTYSSYSPAPVAYEPVPYAQPSIEPYPTVYSSPQPVTYSSAPVVNYPAETYSSNGTYASSSYPGNSYSQPVTYTSAPVSQPVTYSQPSYSQPTYSQPAAYSQPVVNQPVVNNYTTSTGSSYASTGNVTPGLAQQKAVQAAQMRLQGHLNNQLGGAKYEGVGWSNQSAQSAIQNCCYWGARPTAQIGVSQAPDGTWYACVLYH